MMRALVVVSPEQLRLAVSVTLEVSVVPQLGVVALAGAAPATTAPTTRAPQHAAAVAARVNRDVCKLSKTSPSLW